MSADVTPPHPIVFVVDDDVSVRESLEMLIANEGWRPELFASAQEFLSRPTLTTPGCVILDVNLPDLDGLAVQERLALTRSHMPIIFITGFGDVPMTVKAMKAGAVEVLTKPYDDDQLLTAIRRALDQSRSALDHEATLGQLRACYTSLSPRERQVMALVVSGRLNKQMADELGIAEITVKIHRGQVMRKMKADSVAALVKMDAKLRPASKPDA
jgi:FixJ family two-component response regulator